MAKSVLPMTKRMPPMAVHVIGLVIFVIALGVLAITKGWMAFFFLPLLILLSPILFIFQIWTNKFCQTHEEWVDRRKVINLAQWQLVTLFWAFLIAPGLWDTPEMLLFGSIRLPDNALWVAFTAIVTIVSFGAFLTITVWQCVTLVKLRKQGRTQKPKDAQ